MRINTEHRTDDELREMGLSRTSIWRARKRGWAHVDYHEKTHDIDANAFDAEAALATAEKCWASRYLFLIEQYGVCPHVELYRIAREDMIQAAVLRCLELSGKSTETPFQWQVCSNTFRDVARASQLKFTFLAANPSDCAPVEISNANEILALLEVLAGVEVYKAALAGNDDAIEKLKQLAWEH